MFFSFLSYPHTSSDLAPVLLVSVMLFVKRPFWVVMLSMLPMESSFVKIFHCIVFDRVKNNMPKFFLIRMPIFFRASMFSKFSDFKPRIILKWLLNTKM